MRYPHRTDEINATENDLRQLPMVAQIHPDLDSDDVLAALEGTGTLDGQGRVLINANAPVVNVARSLARAGMSLRTNLETNMPLIAPSLGYVKHGLDWSVDFSPEDGTTGVCPDCGSHDVGPGSVLLYTAAAGNRVMSDSTEMECHSCGLRGRDIGQGY